MTWITSILGFGKSIFGNRLLMAGILLAFTSGAASGWYVKNKFAEAKELKELKIQAEMQKEAVRRVIKQYEDVMAVNDEILEEYTESLGDISVVERVVYEKVVEYVQDNRACDLNDDTVRLLNMARTNSDNREEVSKATKDPNAESRSTPAITQREEIKYHIGCGLSYQRLMTKHNLLIDWINKTNKGEEDE